MKPLIPEHAAAMRFADQLIPKGDRTMTIPASWRKPAIEPPVTICPECDEECQTEWVNFGCGLDNPDGSPYVAWHLATVCCGAPLDALERTLR